MARKDSPVIEPATVATDDSQGRTTGPIIITRSDRLAWDFCLNATGTVDDARRVAYFSVGYAGIAAVGRKMAGKSALWDDLPS